MVERLQKFLARAGVASRREAEKLIASGRVAVNNQTVAEMGTKVAPGSDLVTVDGRLVDAPEARSYFLFYKPPGVVTTMQDPQGRQTIADFVDQIPGRVFPVGRLDYDAEGALLLTDDGALAHRLTHPKFGVLRVYLAKVRGVPTPEALEKLRRGVRLEDGMASPKSVEIFEKVEKNTWLKIAVSEGRPHLIKRLCAAIGHPVQRLFRPSHGGLAIGGLRPGEMRALSAAEIALVRRIAQGERPPAQPKMHLPARRHRPTAPAGPTPSPEPPPISRPRRNAGRRR
jgi:23S rRNA pseudouridine2605 synthase